MGDPKEADRRAAALDALRAAPPAEPRTFWQEHGNKILLAGGILLALWLVMRMVGGFLRTSADETSRAEEEIRRGLKR